MTLPRSLIASLAFLAASTVMAQTRSSGNLDTYGYSVADSSALTCPAQFVDIASQGDLLALSSTDNGVPASDDGGAAITLSAPFELYGAALSNLVVSSNGYLAAAGSLDEEDGRDFSNDCPMPAVPDNPHAQAKRIAVYHDELDGSSSSGTIRSNYFAVCPRPAASGSSEACTVVQWENWRKVGDATPLRFQAILYHASFEISLQFHDVDASQGNSASVGLQDPAAGTAAVYGCNGSQPIAAAHAVCFFDPRFTPGVSNDGIFANGFEAPAGR
jgi:hypothetical protein